MHPLPEFCLLIKESANVHYGTQFCRFISRNQFDLSKGTISRGMPGTCKAGITFPYPKLLYIKVTSSFLFYLHEIMLLATTQGHVSMI